jgi:hypothetical protein
LACPASVGLVAKVPPHLRRVSSHAARGSALHEAIAHLLAEDVHVPVENLTGKTFGNYTITCDDVATTLAPAYAYVESTFLDLPGAEYFLEQRVTFPTIANTFGTCDLLVRIGRTIFVIDFKFGAGVRVLALTPDGDEDIVNSQLAFYACAARHSLPEFFADVRNVVLLVVQPQTIEPDAEMVSSVTVTHAELDEFITAYRAACAQALSDTPRLQSGAWCRFCPARPICPAHTGPLLDLTQFTVPGVKALSKEAYLQVLAEGLNLVDAIKDIRTALHEQAKRALEQGDSVPGYALTAGRAARHWRDENAVLAALQSAGFYYDDVMSSEMRSPKQVELRAKARGLRIPDDLIVSNRSGVSLVRVENARAPVLGRVETARLFSEALKTFQGRQR